MPYSEGGKVRIPESLVVEIWQNLLLDRTELTTESGELVKIIYPGIINSDRGADFQNAVIATSQGLIRGDIEVHVKSSDWQAHQHHDDPHYNRVILHVVMWDNSEATTNLHDGRKIPVLALYRYIKSPISRWPSLRGDFVLKSPKRPFGGLLSIPCLKAAGYLIASIVTEFLDNAGEERFLAKAVRFQADLEQMEAGQCLYQGIMGALGYSKNKIPFLELASRLPLQTLESITHYQLSDEECLARLQALLLGTAGLLPSQCPNWYRRNQADDNWIDKLEGLWASSCHTRVMSCDAWYLFKVRPNNFPVRRIVAMSYLILRYGRRGLLEEVVDMVGKAPTRKGYHRLEKGFMVTTKGYWASHFNFDSDSRLTTMTLLGRRRAADIVVNVLLPFTYAWSKLTLQPELERKALDFYRSYPRLTVNTVGRHMMNQLGLSSRLVNSAQRQQGLIHIYNTLCTQGRCNCCQLGKAALTQLETRNHIQI